MINAIRRHVEVGLELHSQWLARVGQHGRQFEMALVVALCLYLFSYHTLLFEQWHLLNNTIKLGVPVLLLVFLGKYKLNRYSELIIFLYLGFIAYTIISCLFSDFVEDALDQWAKFYFRILFLIFLLLFLSTKDWSARIYRFLIALGVFFSVQSILLWLVILFKIPLAPTDFYLPRWELPIKSYGILGYSQTIESLGTGLFYRCSSYFVEPSLFAEFLLVPMALSIGEFEITKRKKYLIIFGVIFVSFILSMSMAGYIAFIGMGFIFIFKRITASKHRVALWGLVAIIGLVLGTLFSNLVDNAKLIPKGQKQFLMYVLTKSFTERTENVETGSNSFEKRLSFMNQALPLKKNRVLGIGMRNPGSGEGENYFPAVIPSAPVGWYVLTGIIGLTILLLISGTVVVFAWKYCFDLRDIRFYLFLAFIGQAIHNLSYGTWFLPLFLLTMALILTYPPVKDHV